MRIIWTWSLFAGSSLWLTSGTPLFPVALAVWFGPLLVCALRAARLEATRARAMKRTQGAAMMSASGEWRNG